MKAALAAALACLLAACQPSASQPPADPHQQVQQRAAERLEGARCVGARATAAQKQAIARLLAIDTLAPRGRLPAWLPDDFANPPQAPSGADAWNALAADCPHAPAFGTPFGFVSADIEQALRQDPEFAAQSDGIWLQIWRLETEAQAARR